MEQDPELLTASQVSDLLEMPHLEVIRRLKKGDIKGKKLGWFWTVKETEVERVKSSDWYIKYIAKRKQAAAA